MAEYKPSQLSSTRECIAYVQIDGRLLTFSLDIKHKSKTTLVPSTVFIDEKNSKMIRFYLLGSKTPTLRATGIARIRSHENETVAVGTFTVRTESSGVFEFQALNQSIENNSNMMVGFDCDQSNRKEWILGGEAVFCFTN